MAYDDDDDWVGEPPEGHYSRDRAKPDFWRLQRPPEVKLYRLSEAAEAHRLSESRHFRGKLIFQVR